MIWLTWRQLRGSVAIMAGVLVVLAAALALTGPGLAERYSKGIADCTPDNTCIEFFDRFFDTYQIPFMAAGLVVLLLPALAGLFWGAPLVTRELEAGTHLLVWNQSITRRRWLAVKLGLTGLIAMVGAGLCGLLVTWWSGPLDKAASEGFAPMDPLVFGARGIAPMGYAAFAFALGVTVGMLVRRTLLAMALTLIIFVAIQLAMPLAVRAHLMPPTTSKFELGAANVDNFGIPRGGGGTLHIRLNSTVPGEGGAWVLSTTVVDRSGRSVTDGGGEAEIKGISTTSGPCAPQGGPPSVDGGCMVEINRLGYRQQATYHPLQRFWSFQWIEAGIYTVLAVGPMWFSFWWIRRRLS